MTAFKIFLWIHIVAGGTGLLSGTINIIRKKGDKYHRLAGQFFFYGMIAAAISALVLSILHPNYFLFIVGVFTFYMVSTGKRYLFLKETAEGQRVQLIDWLLTIMMIVFGIVFILFGTWHLIKQQSFGTVFIIFGSIGLTMAITDIKNYTGKSEYRNTWLLVHLQRMTGAYIASFTAFLVVNNTYLPGIIAWLLPTLLITPLIFKWSKQYAVKKKTLSSPGS